MLRGKCEGNGVPKVVELTPLKNINEQKQSKNAGKGTKRRKWRIEKMMKMKRKEMNRRTKQMILHEMKNDPWSDHPKTQFGPIYSFFQNREP